ncbi:MAG TPA: CoA transferase [Nevskiaceae bacterium]|nr:CoA transferase [Nevskiaceae bacterium]
MSAPTSGRPTFPPYRSRPPDAPVALEGVRVVDFSRVLAGPYCTQMLADLGAEVIKIEEIGTGDQIRNLDPRIGDTSTYFWSLNRNKRSVAVDLGSDEGRAVVLDLIAHADVVVENYTTRVMQKFRLDYPSIGAQFPRLVYCSISGYGRTGPLANVPAYDSMIAAESGQLSFNCAPGERPVVNSVPIIDFMASMNATIGILSALRARDRLGRGQFIDVAMFDSAIACLAYRGTDYFAAGVNPEPTGRVSKTSAPGGEFDVVDGSIWVMITSDKMFERLARDVFGRPDLLADPRFATHEQRHRNLAAVNAAVQDLVRDRPRKHWVDAMRAAGIPVGAVRTVAEAYHAEEAAARGVMSSLPHPAFGPVPNISSVFRHMSLTPAVDPVLAPPLGAHTGQVLRDVAGYDADRIAALADRGVIGLAASP